MPPPIGLVNLSIGDLIGAAGGDPWKMNDELQTGDPGAINAQADAFHAAAGSATEIESDFKNAKRRFEQGWTSNGSEHPINASAEVTQATDQLHLQKPQLAKIALDLENVATALAAAKRASDADIVALDNQLHQIDDAMTHANANNQDTDSMHDEAVRAVRKGLDEVQEARNGYVAAMAAAKPSLDTATGPPLIGPGINGTAPTGKPDPNGPLIGPGGIGPAPAGAPAGGNGWDWHPVTRGDVALTAASAVGGTAADGARGAALDAMKNGPKTGPGAADPSLLKWLEDPKIGGVELTGFSRVSRVLGPASAIPSVLSDMHDGNSATEAVVRESAGTAAGLWLGGAAGGIAADMAAGAVIGSVFPGAGTAVGLVVGAGVGAVTALGVSKVVEAGWQPITNVVGSAVHGVESVFGFG
ncbi:hypothetical protein MAUB1S_01098 [Mycolicibacterium aubagnense]